MDAIRFNPFAEVTSLRDQISRLIDEAGQSRTERPQNAGSRLWAPPVDVVETENDLIVRLDLPGVDQQSIDVQLTGETLAIRGERRFERREGQGYILLERPYGTFQRTFSVGVPLQAERVSATYRDGVLTLTLPKQEAVKPRKIQIQSEAASGQG